MVRHIASGGGSRVVSRFRYSQVVALANHSLGRPRVCGRKGEAIAGHNRVLAALADFRGHHSGSATASVAARLSAPAAALFARSEWKRRVVERRKIVAGGGGSQEPHLALGARGPPLREGRPVRDVVRARAIPAWLESDAPGEKLQAGPIPLRPLAGLEAFSSQNLEPSTFHSARLLTTPYVHGNGGGAAVEHGRLDRRRARMWQLGRGPALRGGRSGEGPEWDPLGGAERGYPGPAHWRGWRGYQPHGGPRRPPSRPGGRWCPSPGRRASPWGGDSFREIDPREGWPLARGWGLADAQLGGRLPPLPPPRTVSGSGEPCRTLHGCRRTLSSAAGG
jgi:hypothetical protein